MKTSIIFSVLIPGILVFSSCKTGNKENTAAKVKPVQKDTKNQGTENIKDVTDFILDGNVIVEKIYGDLNKDGKDDCVVLTKETDKTKFVKDEHRGVLDRNRRGLIILIYKNGSYDVVLKNPSCFSSENEDGGVYYPPELSVEIKKGNLYINYNHGRYGYWSYTFRYQNSDFEMIGYDDSDNFGPRINSEVSINYLTKKKIIKVNTNENAEGGDEVFEETIEKVNINQLTKLSEIKDFDGLDN